MHGYPNWQAAKALHTRPAPSPEPVTVFVLWSYGADLWFFGSGGQLLNFFYSDELKSATQACRLIRNAIHAASSQETTFVHKDARFLTDLCQDEGEFDGMGESDILGRLLERHGPAWLAGLAPEPTGGEHEALYTGGDSLCTPSSVTP